MQKVKFVYWEEDGAWIGYLQACPELAEGTTLIIGPRARPWTTSKTIFGTFITTFPVRYNTDAVSSHHRQDWQDGS